MFLRDSPAVFPLDDAYIHLAYARNLAAGHGWCFNPGQTSFGTSSPLWVVLIAMCIKTGIDPYHAALLLSFACHFFSAVLIFRITGGLLATAGTAVARKVYPLTAALLYILSGNVTWLSLSGMETPLFHLLALWCIFLYQKKGLGTATAIAAGALLLCRITGIFLVIPLLFSDALQRKRVTLKAAVPFLTAAPYYLYHGAVTGSLFPVTAAGKLLTYVDGGADASSALRFLSAFVKYLFLYEPSFLLLAGAALVACIHSVVTGTVRQTGPVQAIILVWIVLHLGFHAGMFRSLNQHSRYLSILFPALSIAGISAAAVTIRKNWLACAALACLLLLCLSRHGYWKDIYYKNTRHMDTVYAECARWIAAHTSDAVVAAFDIGIIKYMTGRFIVDLGGVTTPSVHPYLETHSAGTLLRKLRVPLVVYSRVPDCDVWTGIYRSRYDRRGLLQQSRLVTFAANTYAAPSITHSFQLDVYRIDRWVPASLKSVSEVFYADIMDKKDIPGERISGHLALVDIELQKDRLQLVENMAQYLEVTYFWKATEKIPARPVIRTVFANCRTGQIVFDKCHTPTHAVFPPDQWQPGRVIRENHTVWIPDSCPAGCYGVWISDAGKPGQAGDIPHDCRHSSDDTARGVIPGDRVLPRGFKAAEFIVERAPVHNAY